VRPGDEITIRLGDDYLLNGYVDGYRESLDSSAHSARITARDKAGDLVDSSSTLEPRVFSGLLLAEIVEKIAEPYGIEVEIIAREQTLFVIDNEPPGQPVTSQLGKHVHVRFDKFEIEPGEGAFAAIERACRMRGVLAYSLGTGILQIGPPAFHYIRTPIVEGRNLVSGEMSYTHAERHDTYIILGQSPGTDFTFGVVAAAVRGEAVDPDVIRHRPLVVLAEGNVTQETAKDRAQWEATVRASRSAKATITLPSWRQSLTLEDADDTNRPLWTINSRVNLEVPTWGFRGRLLVDTVRYLRSPDRGTTCDLTLVRPDAYTPKPEVDSKAEPFSLLDNFREAPR
jgi:prophage tail gpP-like protein